MNIKPDQNNQEIDLRDLLKILFDKKILIASITSFAALISIIYALSLPNIYTSSAILAPSSPDESLSSSLGQFSGIASFAGFRLPNTAVTKSDEAIKRIKSYDFFQKRFLTNIQLENLLAVKKWSSEKNKLIYNNDIYDDSSAKWVDNKKPTEQEAFIFFKKILKVNKVSGTGFYNISIDHKSPNIAKKWLDLIILNINESMREIDKQNSLNSISFLNELESSTNIQSVKAMTANLLEIQMQTLMLASSNEAYIFKIIDSPIAPEKKSGPSRSLICILGTLFGGMISLLISFFMHYRDSLK